MIALGIDGSSAYSRLVGMDNTETQKVVGRHMGNSIDLHKWPWEQVQDHLTRLIQEFGRFTNTTPAHVKSICLGIAGDVTPETEETYSNIFKHLGFDCPLLVTTDLNIMLATETKGEPGILVVAATDARAYALDAHQRTHHCGGWGHLLDGVGSGYGMGIAAIQYALKAYDDRLPSSGLLEKVCTHFSMTDLRQLTGYMYSEHFSKNKISELAPIIKYAAEGGDPHAKQIEQDAVNDLYEMARALILRCKMTQGPLVLAGSVFLLNNNIREGFTAQIKKEFPQAHVVLAREKAEMGAVYLAQRLITS